MEDETRNDNFGSETSYSEPVQIQDENTDQRFGLDTQPEFPGSEDKTNSSNVEVEEEQIFKERDSPLQKAGEIRLELDSDTVGAMRWNNEEVEQVEKIEDQEVVQVRIMGNQEVGQVRERDQAEEEQVKIKDHKTGPVLVGEDQAEGQVQEKDVQEKGQVKEMEDQAKGSEYQNQVQEIMDQNLHTNRENVINCIQEPGVIEVRVESGLNGLASTDDQELSNLIDYENSDIEINVLPGNNSLTFSSLNLLNATEENEKSISALKQIEWNSVPPYGADLLYSVPGVTKPAHDKLNSESERLVRDILEKDVLTFVINPITQPENKPNFFVGNVTNTDSVKEESITVVDKIDDLNISCGPLSSDEDQEPSIEKYSSLCLHGEGLDPSSSTFNSLDLNISPGELIAEIHPNKSEGEVTMPCSEPTETPVLDSLHHDLSLLSDSELSMRSSRSNQALISSLSEGEWRASPRQLQRLANMASSFRII